MKEIAKFETCLLNVTLRDGCDCVLTCESDISVKDKTQVLLKMPTIRHCYEFKMICAAFSTRGYVKNLSMSLRGLFHWEVKWTIVDQFDSDVDVAVFDTLAEATEFIGMLANWVRCGTYISNFTLYEDEGVLYLKNDRVNGSFFFAFDSGTTAKLVDKLSINLL